MSADADALAQADLDWYVTFASESHDGIRAAIQSRMAIGILPESDASRLTRSTEPSSKPKAEPTG